MVYRIEIASKIPDTRALMRLKNFQELASVAKVEIVDVYTIDKNFTFAQLKSITKALVNSITQQSILGSKRNKNRYLPNGQYDWVIETGYLPGVTDNIATTSKEIISDLTKLKFKNSENVYTSQLTFIKGKLGRYEIENLAGSLTNPLMQRTNIKSFKDYKDSGMDFITPKVSLKNNQRVSLVDLEVDDEHLREIGKSGIKNTDNTRRGPLALDLSYMKAIQNHFRKLNRKPTDIEIESLAQSWSEHCKHTIFADPIDEIREGLYKKYIKAATEKIRKAKGKKDFCASVFSDNSGAIIFDEKYLITHKVETHNSPSALDPFGGAITGIVGVNRDTIGFGLGAKPVANIYGFCVANPKDSKSIFRASDFRQPMLSPKRILEGVVAGINSGGNCSGIPTPQGFVYFDGSYKGKPLVFAGTVGLITKKINGKVSFYKKAEGGDYIVMVGGRVGLDGIHGATFASVALDTGSPATAVQIGDPITQKKLSDAIIKEARDLDLYDSITDNGAGGLSSSVAEMAKEAGGFIVDLEKVPLKYPGLDPWQIWISESQERMTLSVPKKKWKDLQKLLTKRGVECTVIGQFTGKKRAVIKYKGQKIMDLDMNFLHNGLPQRPMKTSSYEVKNVKNKVLNNLDPNKTLLKMVSQLNLASFESISAQYDHEVQAGSVIKPLQGKGRVNGDAVVFKPVLDSDKGVVLSHALYPSYSPISAYDMAANTIDTAIRNAVAAGANPEYLALLDNFCWCSSNDPRRLAQLKEAVKACFDLATSFGTPFISGKDSMSNDFLGFDHKNKPIKISVLPTLLISAIGVIDDCLRAISIDPKFPGDLIYLIGETGEELGGSEFYRMLNVSTAGETPKVTARINKKIYTRFYQSVQRELISSAVSVSKGGLGMAFAKMAMSGLLGLKANLKKISGENKNIENVLYSESAGRIILTINPANKKQFENVLYGTSFALIGEVNKTGSLVIDGKNYSISLPIDQLLKSYKKTLKEF